MTRPTLKRGSLGLPVQELQRRLGVRADAIFGPDTFAALMKFQIEHGLKADGVVDEATNRALFGDEDGKTWTEFREDE